VPPDPDELRSFACSVAREAGDLLRGRFLERGSLDVTTKGPHDFVTEADLAAEACIVKRIEERFPDHAILAEEGSVEEVAAEYCWIVDPLDATTNFIHGVPLFSVSIAVEGPAGMLAGAVFDPLRDEMFHAVAGGGARLNDEPIACSTTSVMSQALIATGFPFRELDRLDAYLETFSTFVKAAAGIRRAGSATLDLAYTACGRYDGFWEVGLKPWDIAAGALLVAEAGGRVTDVGGGDAFMSGDIVAASPRIHAEMLATTRRVLA
jgi:myo-inositol-1(or 4)-monophosphatase